MNTREWYKVGDKAYVNVGTRRGEPVIISSIIAWPVTGSVGYNVVALDGAHLAYTHNELSSERVEVLNDG